MEFYIKKHNFMLIVILCLFSCKVFSASEATKKLINETLAKYGISAGGKEVCGTGREPDYDTKTGIVKCRNTYDGDLNNCWDKYTRLCKPCPNGTIVSEKDHITCREIICPEGYELKEIVNNECPKGFELKEFKDHECGEDRYGYDDVMATNNYTTKLINCKNIKYK